MGNDALLKTVDKEETLVNYKYFQWLFLANSRANDLKLRGFTH